MERLFLLQCDPGGIRTHNQRYRKPSFYPVELRSQKLMRKYKNIAFAKRYHNHQKLQQHPAVQVLAVIEL